MHTNRLDTQTDTNTHLVATSRCQHCVRIINGQITDFFLVPAERGEEKVSVKRPALNKPVVCSLQHSKCVCVLLNKIKCKSIYIHLCNGESMNTTLLL